MALSIKNEEADRLVREIAKRTGESLTEVVLVALRERFNRLPKPSQRRLADQLDAIALHCASLPIRDARPADEILDYDERGLPR